MKTDKIFAVIATTFMAAIVIISCGRKPGANTPPATDSGPITYAEVLASDDLKESFKNRNVDVTKNCMRVATNEKTKVQSIEFVHVPKDGCRSPDALTKKSIAKLTLAVQPTAPKDKADKGSYFLFKKGAVDVGDGFLRTGTKQMVIHRLCSEATGGDTSYTHNPIRHRLQVTAGQITDVVTVAAPGPVLGGPKGAAPPAEMAPRPKLEAPKVKDLPKVELPKVEAPKVKDLPKIDVK